MAAARPYTVLRKARAPSLTDRARVTSAGLRFRDELTLIKFLTQRKSGGNSLIDKSWNSGTLLETPLKTLNL
jgi:hypothetical protein